MQTNMSACGKIIFLVQQNQMRSQIINIKLIELHDRDNMFFFICQNKENEA